MACEGPEGEVESAYLANLTEVASWASDGAPMTLGDADGSAILAYEVSPEASVVGGWMAQGINNGAQAVVSTELTPGVTAVFDAEGSLTGSDGCNSYFTTYEVEGDGITVSPQIGATRVACSEEIMQLAEQYYAALLAATAWAVDPAGSLELRDGSGALQVRFLPATR